MTDTDKLFTPEGATKTLPLVRRIVEDLLSSGRELNRMTEGNTQLGDNSPPVVRKVNEINGYIQELEDLGCAYKDWNFDVGLIDFPAIIDGNDVLLCWRSDEASVLHYHGLGDGVEGRKAIPEYLLSPKDSNTLEVS